MTDDKRVVSADIGVAKIGMWQAVLVAAITSAASIFITIYVRPKPSNAEPVNTAAGSTPLYTQNVDNFLHSQEQEGEPYKWNGYRRDVLRLHSLVEEFLSSFTKNPPKYQDARSFYDDLEKAADLVHDRAKIVDQSGEQMVDFNWKVYCAPYLFRLEIQQLKAAHMANQLDTEPKIDEFKKEFDAWLMHQSGESFQAGEI